ncbi:hypothetical protein [Frankia sp. CiP1_Cm_nod2]|uniref:hypothetical protein n=1 Tax=Frankia sp. CiP1_Cm_nod2 TaxID=2897161 RepID=UPI002023CCA5
MTGAGRRPSRRGVLGALPLAATAALTGALASELTGCSWTRSAYGPGGPGGPDTVDNTLLEAVTRSEQGLLVAYDQAILAHPSIAATLAVLRAHHAEHAGRIGSAVTGGFTIMTSPPGTPQQTTVPQQTAASQQATVAALVQLERQAAALLRARCLTAAVGVVPLLASIHASELAHADLLTQLAR